MTAFKGIVLTVLGGLLMWVLLIVWAVWIFGL